MMQTAIEVLVPVPRRWAQGRWRSALQAERTRDLRVVFLLAGCGLAFWVAAVWLVVSLAS